MALLERVVEDHFYTHPDLYRLLDHVLAELRG